MAVKRLKWNSLLHLPDLQFEPEEPKQLTVTDELVMAISWLTAATKHDRKLLRCDENGALLIANAWSLLVVDENDELYPDADLPDDFITTKENKGVLVATSTQIVLLVFLRVVGGATESIYVPPETLYWYPKSVVKVTVVNVPSDGGEPSYVGITTFK